MNALTLSIFPALVLLAGAARLPAHRAFHLVVPQSRAWCSGPRQEIRITGVAVTARVLDQSATTTMDVSLANPGSSTLEAELLVPVPANAVVRGFTFEGPAPEAEACEAEARVLPVEAGGTQKVRLIYEHLLPRRGDRLDYVVPRSESPDYAVPWSFDIEVSASRFLSTVYSPSHPVRAERLSPHSIRVRARGADASRPGPFRLAVLAGSSGLTATLFAYPDPKAAGTTPDNPKEGGYFLLLAGLPQASPAAPGRPAPAPAPAPALRRCVTLVLDRSGSMKGDKIEQVRETALRVVAGLTEEEAFNILAYNDGVTRLARGPRIRSQQSTDTAFPAREGTDLSDREAILTEARANFRKRAWACRTGVGGVNQELNNDSMINQSSLNPANSYLDASMNRVSVTAVRQINDLTFYRRNGCWVDARLMTGRGKDPRDAAPHGAALPPVPHRTVSLGDPEFPELASRLAAAGRQGSLALGSDVLMEVDGDTVLLRTAPGKERPVPVRVRAVPPPATVPEGDPILIQVVIETSLPSPISFVTFALAPTPYDGETLNISLVDIRREGEGGSLFLERPHLTSHRWNEARRKTEFFHIAGPSAHAVRRGKPLAVSIDARKWKIRGGWRPGRYRLTVRVENLVLGPYTTISVLSDPVQLVVR